MKKTIQLSVFTALTGILLITIGCSKSNSSAPLNTVVIKLNGTPQIVDSLVVKSKLYNSKIIEIDMIANKLGGTDAVAGIALLFAPSNPAYAAGAHLNLANGDAEVNYLDNTGNFYDDDPFLFPSVNLDPAGTIIITKNDTTVRRIEGTLSGCVLPRAEGSSGSASVTLDGSFAITYPAQ